MNTVHLGDKLAAADLKNKVSDLEAAAESRAQKLRDANKENRRLRKALYMCASHCQGGHSCAGEEASEVLGVPFPIRMPTLEAAAVRDGFDPDELWPWLRPMKEGRVS